MKTHCAQPTQFCSFIIRTSLCKPRACVLGIDFYVFIFGLQFTFLSNGTVMAGQDHWMFSNPSQSNAQILICQKKGASLFPIFPKQNSPLGRGMCRPRFQNPVRRQPSTAHFQKDPKTSALPDHKWFWPPRVCQIRKIAPWKIWKNVYTEKKIMVLRHPSFL